MPADPLEVDPKHYKLEYEDDRVRVLRIRYGPQEKSVMHAHMPGVVVMLSDCDFRFYFPRGKVQNIFGRVGQVFCFEEAYEHQPENLSDKPFEAIFIELKG